MIVYNLKCEKDHIFETWFRDSATYDRQAAAGEVLCPVCGSGTVEKAIMAPRLAKSAGRDRGHREDQPAPSGGAGGATVGGATAKALREGERSAKVRRALAELRHQVEENFDYVGPQFAEEARKIHYGETGERAIYGETSDEEAEALEEEGVGVQRIPWLPREDS
jgi:hypothetical protein